MNDSTRANRHTMQPALVLMVLIPIFNWPQFTSFGQGSLTPPGPPGPTMKSLDQVEARTAITNSGAVTISQSGSYYLTRNITVNSGDAITINSDNVTLDLNGFTISSTAPAANGVAINLVGTRRNISIGNGFIQSGVTNNAGVFNGSGFGYGIDYATVSPVNVRVANVTISGVLYYGIFLDGYSTTIQSCLVDTAGDTGLDAGIITDSFAQNCGTGAAINGTTVNNCTGNSIGSGYGILANYANHSNGSSATGHGVYVYQNANNCTGSSSGSGKGLYAHMAINCAGYNTSSGNGLEATMAQNCFGTSVGGIGVNAAVVQNCYGSSTGGAGLYASQTALNCYGETAGGTGVSGLQTPGTAGNCSGSSPAWHGVEATVAIGCTGSSASNYGVWGNNIAVACVGTGPFGAHGARMYSMPGCSGCP